MLFKLLSCCTVYCHIPRTWSEYFSIASVYTWDSRRKIFFFSFLIRSRSFCWSSGWSFFTEVLHLLGGCARLVFSMLNCDTAERKDRCSFSSRSSSLPSGLPCVSHFLCINLQAERTEHESRTVIWFLHHGMRHWEQTSIAGKSVSEKICPAYNGSFQNH